MYNIYLLPLFSEHRFIMSKTANSKTNNVKIIFSGYILQEKSQKQLTGRNLHLNIVLFHVFGLLLTPQAEQTLNLTGSYGRDLPRKKTSKN